MPENAGASTRDRLITESLRLFGADGYAATSVSDIEEAAGLSPGSGSLYRHFSSKRELLAAGIRRQIAEGRGLIEFLGDPHVLSNLPLRERLTAVARAGLQRLRAEADLNRILIRDLKQFPDLLAAARDDELNRVHSAVAGWLAAQVPDAPGAQAQQRSPQEWTALAAVIVGSISHYWVLVDIFGEHPAGVSEDSYLTGLADLVAARIELGPRDDEQVDAAAGTGSESARADDRKNGKGTQ